MKFKEKPVEQIMCDCGRAALEIRLVERHIHSNNPLWDENAANSTEEYYVYTDGCLFCLNEAELKFERLRAIDKIVKESNLGKKYQSFDLSKVKPSVAHAMNQSLYLYGMTGRGKTFAIASKWKAELEAGKNPVFISTFDLILKLQETQRQNSTMSESSVLNYYSSKILFLDDIGAEKLSDFALSRITQIIDRRYVNNLRTVITSNLSIAQLKDLYGERLASRIRGLCNLMEMAGKDERAIRSIPKEG